MYYCNIIRLHLSTLLFVDSTEKLIETRLYQAGTLVLNVTNTAREFKLKTGSARKSFGSVG